jgi:hypothetical protein
MSKHYDVAAGRRVMHDKDQSSVQGNAAFHACPEEARNQPAEFVYVACLYSGTGIEEPDFIVGFKKLDTGPARPHEVHLPGGDCTTEIFQ